MTIYDEVIGALANDPEIKTSYEALSPGDRSILALLLENDAGVGSTVEGSPNQRFWRRLCGYGWMSESDAPGFDSPSPLLTFQITDCGFRAIPVVLHKLVGDQQTSE